MNDPAPFEFKPARSNSNRQALEVNTSVALLDASGCGVSPATCSVLVETLAANSA